MENNIFNLKHYKGHLINYYKWEYDASEEKRLERKAVINQRYTDDYLKSIIGNTQEFSKKLLDILAKENNIWEGDIYTSLELPLEDECISNHCGGGWCADRLFFTDYKKQPISLYLLEEFLGKKSRVDLGDDIIEEYNAQEEAGTEYAVHIIDISIPLERFRELCEANSPNQNKQEICQEQ